MNLYGWDTGYATTIAEVNKALTDPKSVLPTFSLSEEGMTLEGKFGAWSIIPGGSGQLLHLQTAIESGTISGGGVAKADLAGLAVQLEVNLQFLPSKLPKHQDLRFNFKTVGKAGTPAGEGVVVPLRTLDPDKKLTFLQSAVLGAGIAQYLVENAASISFAFASINLVAPSTADSWLTPVSCGYAYFQTTAGAGYMVVLSATDKRDIGKLTRQVDPELVAGAGDGFYAISEGLFLQHVIEPVLPKVYPGTNASFYAFDGKNNVINGTKAFGVGSVKSGLITYYPRITSLQIKVSGASVTTTVSGDCDMKLGMSLTFRIVSNSASSFNAATATLTLAKDPHPAQSHQSHIPWYDFLAGPLPDIIMAIVVPLVADGIAGGLNSAVASMSFAKVGPQSVMWAGMKKITIVGGALNKDFRLWGNVGG